MSSDSSNVRAIPVCCLRSCGCGSGHAMHVTTIIRESSRDFFVYCIDSMIICIHLDALIFMAWMVVAGMGQKLVCCLWARHLQGYDFSSLSTSSLFIAVVAVVMRPIGSKGDVDRNDGSAEHQERGPGSVIAPVHGYGVVKTWGDASRNDCISNMECIEPSKPGERYKVLISKKNGLVQLVDVDEKDGFHVVWQQNAGVTGGAEAVSAHVMLSPAITGKANDSCLVSVFMEHGNGQVYDVGNANEQGDPVAEFRCPPRVRCTAHHPASRRFAVGCEGAELKVYEYHDDVQASGDGWLTLSFQAKGGKPNSVGLCDRPWNSAVAFNPGQEDGTHVLTGTGYGKIRLYDTNIGRRPQMDVPFKGFRITCIAPEKNGNRWWVGDAGGNLQVFDARAGKYCGAIKGIGGSVRSLDIHSDQPLIASAGLDRFMRVNSTTSRSSRTKVYATSQLTAVRFLSRLDHSTDQLKSSDTSIMEGQKQAPSQDALTREEDKKKRKKLRRV